MIFKREMKARRGEGDDGERKGKKGKRKKKRVAS